MSYRELVRRELRSCDLWRDLAAEGVATFVLVAVQCALPLTWGGEASASLLQTALGMGLVVALLIESFAHYGGAHMNPAVTVSMLLCNKVTVTRALCYVIIQCACAIAGAAFIYVVTPAGRRERLATTDLSPELAAWQGVVVEAFLTFVIASTVHGATNSARRPVRMPALPIGFSVTVTILAGAHYTGASMNCARSLGPAVVMNIWTNHWIYWAGPMTGGVIAALLHHYCLHRIGKNRLPDNERSQSESTNATGVSMVDISSNNGDIKRCVCKCE